MSPEGGAVKEEARTDSNGPASATRAQRSWREGTILLASGLIVASIFLFDISLKIGFVVSILYVIPVMVCVWSPRRRTVFIVASAASLLTLLAVPLKPPGEMLIPLFNRPLSLLVLWALTFMVDRWRRDSIVIKESQADLQLAQSVSKTGSWRLDAKHGALTWSDEAYRIFGVAPGTPVTYELFLGKVHPEDKALVDEKWRSALRGAPYDIEHRVLIDGQTKWLREKALVESAGKGEIEVGFGTVQDITDIMRAQQAIEEYAGKLQRSNAELERFAYVASHDLQEPIRMVINNLGLLEKHGGEGLDPRDRQYLRAAVEGGQRMRGLIDDLLAYSRVDSQVRPFVEVDMGEVLRKTEETMQATIETTGATILSDGLPTVLADESMMRRLMENLIGNALKFHGKEKPVIRVSAEERQDDFLFRVQDNGIGIGSEHHERIFEMFTRLDGAEDVPGTGMGLAISKKIVERHGGRIWVESEEGKGATFLFTVAKAVADE